MYEVELKVRADHDRVRRRLEELGADPRGTVRQVDTYFDAPHRDFAETDEAFRLRRSHEDDGTTASVTYKGPLVESASKTRVEHETDVADAEAAEAIVDALGFTPAATVEKARERYSLEGYAVALDAVTDLGAFVEVETTVAGNAATDVGPAREGAADVLRRLGLDPDDQLRTSYLGLLLADG